MSTPQSPSTATDAPEGWELAVGGWLERYRIRDAQTSGSQPYMPGGFFLAENNGDYHGNVVYLRATYRF